MSPTVLHRKVKPSSDQVCSEVLKPFHTFKRYKKIIHKWSAPLMHPFRFIKPSLRLTQFAFMQSSFPHFFCGKKSSFPHTKLNRVRQSSYSCKLVSIRGPRYKSSNKIFNNNSTNFLT